MRSNLGEERLIRARRLFRKWLACSQSVASPARVTRPHRAFRAVGLRRQRKRHVLHRAGRFRHRLTVFNHGFGWFLGRPGGTKAPAVSELPVRVVSAGPQVDDAESRSKGNPDPSRAPRKIVATVARGIAAGGPRGYPDGRAVLPDSADIADWHSAAARAGLGGGRRSCSSAVHGHSGNTDRTQRGTRFRGKSVAGEPLRHGPPCLFSRRRWTTARVSWQLRTSFGWRPHEGCHSGTPPLDAAGFLSCFPPSRPHYTAFG